MASHREADIVYSADDGGWYASLWVYDHDTGQVSDDKVSDVFATRGEAEAWARQNKAKELHWPGSEA